MKLMKQKGQQIEYYNNLLHNQKQYWAEQYVATLGMKMKWF